MATPIPFDTLVAALKAEGCKVELYPGARDMCRCHNGSHANGGPQVRPFNPRGVMTHITAGALGGRSVQSYIRDIIVSDPALPLKCQFVTAPDGTVWVVSAGRCNHAGSISAKAAAGLAAGSFPTSGYADWRGSGTDGNTLVYGIENIAASSMTAAQREASVRINAAICRHYGWKGGECIGHGEASNQRGYADPNLNMGEFRKDVQARLTSPGKPPINSSPGTGAGGGGGTGPSIPTPTPPAKEDDMPKQTPWRSNPDDQKIPTRNWTTIRCDKGGAVSVLNEAQGALLAETDIALICTGLLSTSVVQVRTYITDNNGKRLSSAYGQEYRGVSRLRFNSVEKLGAANRRVYVEVWSTTPCTVTQVGARAIYWN